MRSESMCGVNDPRRGVMMTRRKPLICEQSLRIVLFCLGSILGSNRF